MPTYTVRRKGEDTILSIAEADNINTARLGASKDLIEVTMSTTDEIIDFVKAGGEKKHYAPISRKKEAPAVDPRQTDLVVQINEGPKDPVILDRKDALEQGGAVVEAAPPEPEATPVHEPAGELAQDELDAEQDQEEGSGSTEAAEQDGSDDPDAWMKGD